MNKLSCFDWLWKNLLKERCSPLIQFMFALISEIFNLLSEELNFMAISTGFPMSFPASSKAVQSSFEPLFVCLSLTVFQKKIGFVIFSS